MNFSIALGAEGTLYLYFQKKHFSQSNKKQPVSDCLR